MTKADAFQDDDDYGGEIWERVRPEPVGPGFGLVGGGGWYKGRAWRSHWLVTSRRPTLLVLPASPIFLKPWWVFLHVVT